MPNALETAVDNLVEFLKTRAPEQNIFWQISRFGGKIIFSGLRDPYNDSADLRETRVVAKVRYSHGVDIEFGDPADSVVIDIKRPLSLQGVTLERQKLRIQAEAGGMSCYGSQLSYDFSTGQWSAKSYIPRRKTKRNFVDCLLRGLQID